MQWQNCLEVVSRKLKAARLPSEMKTNMKRENDLMSCLLSDPEVRVFVASWLEKRYNDRTRKSLNKAKMFKTVGNQEFEAKNYSASIDSYTKSAKHAPAGSEYLPVAIANRSASLFYLGKYKECIKDIELAIKLEYPEALRYKLYLRAVQCYIKLGKKNSANEALTRVSDAIKNCGDISDVKREDIKKQLSQLTLVISIMQNDVEDDQEDARCSLKPKLSFGENPDFPCASAAVDRKYSADKGRHVVANRNIKRGDTLFVEKPFTFVLVDHEAPNGLCEHCCRPYDNTPIPCTMCLDTLYCDINCLNEGWSAYHCWKCVGSQMDLWQQIGIAQLALKVLLVCTTTPDKVSFNEVQKLVTNFDKLSIRDLLVYGITAAMLTIYLSKYTNFFKAVNLKECLVDKFSDDALNFNCDISTEDGKQIYVSSLLLRHILQLVCNGHAITKLNTIMSDKDKILTEQQDRVATAIYPSASMMNHSCDPNIISSFMDQYLIVKAIKDIAAGEEIFNCYGPHFRRMPKAQRQEVLRNQYCFTCKCEACVLAEYEYFTERFNAIKCPECNGALYGVHAYSLHCLDCGAMPVINYQKELRKAQELFDLAQACVDLEEEEDALDKLKQCLSIQKTFLYKYNKAISTTLDMIGKVYALMGRWLESISYLEHSIVAVEERFGSSSIELANELNKLTDICIRYLQEETNTSTKWYKNTLKKTRRYLERAEEIINLNYGPWNDSCGEIIEKKKVLSTLLKDFNI